MGYYSGRGDCMYGRGDYYGGYGRGDYYRGDPFSLGSVFGGIAKVGGALLTGGPLAAVATAGSLLSGSTQKPPPLGSAPGVSVSTYQPPMIIPPAPSQIDRPIISFGGNLGPIQGGLSIGGSPVPPSYPAPIGPTGAMGAVTPVSTPGGVALVPCQVKGTHLNKSTYYRNGARIPKGTVCVKNRRMNVANPRALRRAIRRAHGFAKLARRVLSYPISKPPKGRALFKKKR